MWNNWLFFGNLDLNGGLADIYPVESQLPHGFGGHLVSQIFLFVDGSANSRNHLYLSGSMALRETISCISMFAGALFLWLSTGTNNNLLKRLSGKSHGPGPIHHHSCSQVKHTTSHGQDLVGLQFGSISQSGNGLPVFFANVASSTIKRLWKEIEQLQYHPVLSLAAALVPPFDHLSSKVLLFPPEVPVEQFNGTMDQTTRADDCGRCSSLSLCNISLIKDAVEPRTGIRFPTILDNHLIGEDTIEVLVGTGSRTMRIIRVKSLNVYAFGLYVHPDSVCQKLGPKYSSIPAGDLKNSPDFYNDLLSEEELGVYLVEALYCLLSNREDIHMTVRLVVNCNGLKINNVRDAFEKSLRARLQKMNPNTDYHCLSVFGSYFNRDIPLPVGTTINFRRTLDGQFITEIGGKTIGAVQSRDLCRAFFDMYIGDVPVSMQAKEEVAENVADLIRRC